MRRRRAWDPASHRRAGWWRSVQLPAVGAGLLLAERVLVGELGTPAMQLRILRHLGDAWMDPVAAVLALETLVAEILVAYLLVVLVLRSLGMLPGIMGRLASRVMFAVTPAAVRRALDLLVGGALLAQATLSLVPPTPSDLVSGQVPTAPVASSNWTGSFGPAFQTVKLPGVVGATRPVPALDRMGPVDTRPTPRRSSAPLPPWLGGGPSNPAPEQPSTTTAPRPGSGTGPDGTAAKPPGHNDKARAGDRGGGDDHAAAAGPHMVQPHDTLWDIAAARLAPADRSAANIHRYWQQVYRDNRPIIGTDPDLIHPGTRLDVPPYDRDHGDQR